MQNNKKNNKLKEEIERKEKILIKELNMIEISTTETTTTLTKQNEQINKIKKDIEIVNDNLTISEKIINKMKGLSFLFINKNKIEEKIEGNNDKKIENIVEKKNTNTLFNILNIFSKEKEEKREENIEENIDVNPLDIVLNQLGKIKNNVNIQQELLKQQNNNLDDIINETNNTNNKIKKLNKNIKKI